MNESSLSEKVNRNDMVTGVNNMEITNEKADDVIVNLSFGQEIPADRKRSSDVDIERQNYYQTNIGTQFETAPQMNGELRTNTADHSMVKNRRFIIKQHKSIDRKIQLSD